MLVSILLIFLKFKILRKKLRMSTFTYIDTGFLGCVSTLISFNIAF